MPPQAKNNLAGLPLMGQLAILALASLVYLGAARAADTSGGIGGTGITTGVGVGPDGGIGGTGITSLGIVQDFGSIFVNGREFFLTPATQISINGRPASESELRRGDSVSVRGDINPVSGRSEALHVNALDTLQGVVDQVDHQARSFTLLNQVVRIHDTSFGYHADGSALALTELQPGDPVNVAAYASSDGTWVATRVSQVDGVQARAILITGSVKGIDRQNNLVTLGNQALPVRAGTIPDNLAPGQWIRIRGQSHNGAFRGDSIDNQQLHLGAPGTRVELSGLVQSTASDHEVSYNGLTLRYQETTQWLAGDAKQIDADTAIAIQGSVETDGSIRVDEIEVGVDLLQVNISATHNIAQGKKLGKAASATKGNSANAGNPGGVGRASTPGLGVGRPVIQRPQIQRPNIPGLPKPNSPSLNRPVNPKN